MDLSEMCCEWKVDGTDSGSCFLGAETSSSAIREEVGYANFKRNICTFHV